jgi:hypothetical protein
MCRMFGESWHRSLHTLSDGLPEAARASKRNGRCDCTSRGSSLLERYPVPRAAGALRVLVAGPERSVIFIGDRPAAAHHLARGVDGNRAAPPPSLTTATARQAGRPGTFRTARLRGQQPVRLRIQLRLTVHGPGEVAHSHRTPRDEADGLDRWAVGEAHRQRLRALGLAGYRLHDARHHWAVRMARAGAPFELIARQLGHRDVAMVAKVYGRFKPDTEERDRWEQAAAARDEAKWSGLVAKRVAKEPSTSKNLDEQSTASPWEREAWDNSRGGTRTRDPGIMSAVL